MFLEPSLILALTTAAFLFAVGLARKSKGAALKPLEFRRAGYYALGLLVVLLALISPLENASEKLVCVHMAQHMLLVLVAAPLLAQSRFDIVLPWAIPYSGRQRLAQSYGRLRKSTLWRYVASPSVIWFAFVASFVAWHAPGPYRAALLHPALHELEHVTLALSAIFFWSMALQGADRGAAIIWLATAAVATGLPGALILFAPHPVYEASISSEATIGWIIEDQQIGGLIMWILGDAIYLFFIARICIGYIDASNETK